MAGAFRLLHTAKTDDVVLKPLPTPNRKTSKRKIRLREPFLLGVEGRSQVRRVRLHRLSRAQSGLNELKGKLRLSAPSFLG